jgi:hypothetical protein
MSDNLKYNEDPKHTDYLLRSEKQKLDAGFLGKIFGAEQSAASSISWVMIFLLTCSGIIVLFFPCTIGTAEYWKIITPIMTLALGYLFGRRNK